MNRNETDFMDRIFEMKKSIDCIEPEAMLTISSKDLFVLAEFTHIDLYGAIALAYTYGAIYGRQTVEVRG